MPRSHIGRAAPIGLALALAASGCGDRYAWASRWNELRGDAYPLDAISREVSGEQVECADVPMTTYRGETLTYQRPVRVATAFASKLEQFERTVARVATRHYGRPPRKILHFGARACRTVRARGERLSEHALGNAIDVSGFLFGPLRASERTYSELPAKLQRAFTVSVRRDWEASPSEPPLDRHARFLRDLVDALEENDVFRGIIGPGHRGHEAHLHLDYAPFGYTLLG